jgi:hypothetical protein
MAGSATRPYRPGPVRYFYWAGVLLGGGFTAVAILAAVSGLVLAEGRATEWVSLASFGAIAGASTVVAWRCSRVGVATSPEGVTLRSVARSRSLRWAEIKGVDVECRRTLIGRPDPTVCVTTVDGGRHFQRELSRNSIFVVGGDDLRQIAESVSAARPEPS